MKLSMDAYGAAGGQCLEYHKGMIAASCSNSWNKG